MMKLLVILFIMKLTAQINIFKCVLISFFTGSSKKFCPSIITLSFISTVGTKYLVCPVLTALFLNDKTKSIFTPWKLG